MNHNRRFTIVATLALAAGLTFTGCSDGAATDEAASSDQTLAQAESAGDAAVQTEEASNQEFRLVSVDEADALAADPNVTVIDVRTPEEFAEGHFARASLIDFYADDFRTKLEGLDRSGNYLIYCRSGNRSGQAADMMKELGFKKVADLDGGVIAWGEAGKALTQ